MPGPFYNRIKDTSTTTGTSDIVVSGSPATGNKTFSARYSVGDLVPYVVVHQTADEWEVGLGIYSATNTIQRAQITESSNSDTIVSFSSGAKDVFVDLAAAYLNDVAVSGQLLARAAFQGLP